MKFSKNSLFQTGVLCGFLSKVYQGDKTLSEVMQKGDFGIGTFDEVHGELIGIDGRFYCIQEDGVAKPVDPAQKTPFAWVVNFEETEQFTLRDINSFTEFSESFNKKISSLNYIYAYRFETHFEKVLCRSESCQKKPYQPLSETLPKLQVNFTYEKMDGAVAGFYFPHYLSMLNIPGHHMHVLDEKGKRGGHLFDFAFKQAVVKVCCIKDYELSLIPSPAFAESKIDSKDLEKAINAVEKREA